MNDQLFPRRFTEVLRPGTYLRIILEGAVGAGDEIRIIERPDHDLRFEKYTLSPLLWPWLRYQPIKLATKQAQWIGNELPTAFGDNNIRKSCSVY